MNFFVKLHFVRNIRFHQWRFWLLHLILPVLAALFLVLIYPHTGLDAMLISPFYDTKTLTFPLRDHWFLETVMHQFLKNLMVTISLIILGLWALGLKSWSSSITRFQHSFNPQRSWIQAYHRQFLWIFVAMVISTTAISILKHLSNHACPWSLLLYGGTQPLIPLFGALPTGAEPGHCFPGGHASGGFALLAFYFAFRDTEPKFAKIGLLASMFFGFAMSWGQMMRGAHFMSHNLWTIWIVWMILLVQYLVWPPQKSDLHTGN